MKQIQRFTMLFYISQQKTNQFDFKEVLIIEMLIIACFNIISQQKIQLIIIKIRMYNKQVGEKHCLPLNYFNLTQLNWNAFYPPAYVQINEPFEENKAKNQFEELKLKYNNLLRQNQELKTKINQFQSLNKTKRIIKRRRQEDIQRQIKCPYLNCSKQYASQVALNLHIKEKHNGGTKKQRQRYAKKIILAEKKHRQYSVQDISLPPGFLQEFKKSILDHLQSDSQILYSQQSF